MTGEHPSNLAAPADGDLASVSADLEEIFFRPGDKVGGSQGFPNRHVLALTGARGRGRGPAMALIAAAAIGLSGGALAVRLLWEPSPGPPTVQAAGATGTPAPNRTAAADIAPATPAPAVTEQASPPVERLSRAGAPEVRAHPMALPRATPAKTRRTASAAAASRHRQSSCGRSGCSYRAVLAADQRLRVAYSQAIRAGVARPVLVAYRDRWARLRNRRERPDRLVDGYASLELGLARQTGVAHRDRRRP